MATACEVRAGVRVLQLRSAEDGIFCGEDSAPGLCVSPALQPELQLGARGGLHHAWRNGARPAAGAGVLRVDVSCSSKPRHTRASPRLAPESKPRGSHLVWVPCPYGFLKSFLSLCFSLRSRRVQVSHIPVWPECLDLNPECWCWES